MNLYEKKIKTKTNYEGSFFNMNTDEVELSNGKISTRQIIIKNSASCVVALTKTKKIIMVNQFRYAIQTQLLEIPAGGFNKNETNSLICAQRELLEETGFKSNHWIKLGLLLPCPGFCNEKLHIFLALNSFKVALPKLDDDEMLTTHLLNFKDIVNKAASGYLTDAKTVGAILKVDFLIKNRKIKI